MIAFSIGFEATHEEEVASALWDLGSVGSHETAAGGARRTWLAYFAASVDPDHVVRRIASVESATAATASVPEVDWVARFRQDFRPFAAGSFRISPAWLEEPPNGRTLIVDPGQAFGTGTHESTRLCLAAMERVAGFEPLGRLADIGAGSGILAIAAARLGARPIVASDIDPEALRSASEHFRLNAVAIPLFLGADARGLASAAFDFVVANIAAAQLVPAAAELIRVTRPGGRLLLSGLLSVEVDDVAAAFARNTAEGFRLLEGEWACLLLRRIAP